MRSVGRADWQVEDRILMPEPLTGIRPVRYQHQRWQRLDRAEGELQIGYDAAGRTVRVEYHWIRWFSRANPDMSDVYTAELWVRQPGGDWLYLLRPAKTRFVAARHADVRAVLARHLNLDVGG
jgi:hypothetical protein